MRIIEFCLLPQSVEIHPSFEDAQLHPILAASADYDSKSYPTSPCCDRSKALAWSFYKILYETLRPAPPQFRFGGPKICGEWNGILFGGK
jgi:hypothetical protein